MESFFVNAELPRGTHRGKHVRQKNDEEHERKPVMVAESVERKKGRDAKM